MNSSNERTQDAEQPTQDLLEAAHALGDLQIHLIRTLRLRDQYDRACTALSRATVVRNHYSALAYDANLRLNSANDQVRRDAAARLKLEEKVELAFKWLLSVGSQHADAIIAAANRYGTAMRMLNEFNLVQDKAKASQRRIAEECESTRVRHDAAHAERGLAVAAVDAASVALLECEQNRPAGADHEALARALLSAAHVYTGTVQMEHPQEIPYVGDLTINLPEDGNQNPVPVTVNFPSA
jgi:hypothetical protein